MLTIDVTEFLTVGPHRLEIVAASVKGPSAVFLKLDVEFSGGELRSIVSDRSWSVTSDSDTPGVVSHGPVSHGPVDSRLILSEPRRVGISAVDNYEQWKQALGAEAGEWLAASFDSLPAATTNTIP